MISLSAHGLRSSSDPSRRSFLITMLGGALMLGYARSGLAALPGVSAGELFEPTIWYLKSLALEDPSGTVPGWVVVFADSFIAANRAADLVRVTWHSGKAATVSERDIQHRAAQLIADANGGSLVVDDPGVDAILASAKQKIERTYTTGTVMHVALEPVNALAFEKDGVFEIHTGNQWQTLILPVLAKALGRSQDTIVLRSYLLGGGFGRRLDGDYTVPAALAAKAIGKPVKMVCTRADDMRFDCPRSPSTQVLRMSWGDGGRVTAMDHHAAAGWPTGVMAPFFMPAGVNRVPYDPFSISGADHWYTVGAQRVRALRNDVAERTFRPGWLRSVGAGWTNWLSRASWTRQRTQPASTLWSFACECSTAPAEMVARRRVPWEARTARRPCSLVWRRRWAGTSRHQEMWGSASRRHSVRNAPCPRGWLAPLACMSTALEAMLRSNN